MQQDQNTREGFHQRTLLSVDVPVKKNINKNLELNQLKNIQNVQKT